MNNIFKKGLRLVYNKLQKYFKEDNNSQIKQNQSKNEFELDKKDNFKSNILNNTNKDNNNYNEVKKEVINENDNKNNNNYSNYQKNNINNLNNNNNNNNNNSNKDNNDGNNSNYLKIKENEQTLENTFIKENEKQPKETYTISEIKNKFNTIWDILKINKDTQAEHLLKIIPSDQWINMEEIKKRIQLEFGIEYKNEKSLYPYLKTLVDINLIKVNNTGKKRSWKKNIIILN